MFHRVSFGKCLVLAALYSTAMTAIPAGADESKEAKIQDALKAAPPTLVDTVTVKDWDGTVLREGSGEYTCMPTPPDVGGTEPMCLDHAWMAWGDAWMNKKPFTPTGSGIAYMLAGDTGASNVDPYAKASTPDNQWIVEGPHLMLLLPDPALLDADPTDPNNGSPYVMWKGTPYAHIMVPVGERPAPQTATQQ
jgi:hypothetical protein